VLKWISPLEERLRHLQRPRMFSERGHLESDGDRTSTGQILAERVAASIGSWRFIGAQAGAMAIWVLINTLALFHVIKFDGYPFVFLNLAMSAEAAFTGPVILIAANVGAIRDHAQSDHIEKLSVQNEKAAEQNEKLAEQNEKLVDQMCQLETMVDQHITASAKAHSAEIADLAELVRSMHASVTALVPATGGSAEPPVAEPAAHPVAQPVSQSATSRRRRDSSSNPQS
jgi:uncharacterized membrane protein